ncbi:MAG TPA: calcium/sodium antiporter [Gammaproteobacteria bacterium]|nr:calcium/sodium antiporter [Gammaproteobacteria bacterium]
MLLAIAAVVAGLVLLVWSSDRFVDGASALAFHFGVSKLVIGLTVVGLGTSAPEMLVSAFAALGGNPALGIGNAIGSNIANIALILGVTALFFPLLAHSRIVRIELPILLGTTLFGGILVYNGFLSRLDGLLLLSMLAAVMVWLVRDSMRNKDDVMAEELASEVEVGLSLREAALWFVVGLVVLLISARMLVWGAVIVAQALGVSDLVIGLTIVAVGTSLPELAASIAGARKGESDLVIGNVIGSNMFNLLGVMAIAGLISPSKIPADVLARDFPLMAGLTIALMLVAFSFRASERHIYRLEGAVLTGVFVVYQYLLFASVDGVGG